MFKRISGILVVLVATSCSVSTPVIKKYKPALFEVGQYMPKPASFDSVQVRNYLSGGYVRMQSDDNFDNDVLSMGLLSFSRGHLTEHFNFAYGIDAFAGKYKNKFINKEDPDYFDSKNIGAVQFKTSLNTFKSYDKSEWRIIGVDLAYSKEFGSFAKLREQIPGKENYYSILNTDLITASVNSEILWKRPRWSYGIRVGVLKKFGNMNYQGIDYTGPSTAKANNINYPFAFHIRQNKLFMILEAMEDTGRLSFGFSF